MNTRHSINVFLFLVLSLSFNSLARTNDSSSSSKDSYYRFDAKAEFENGNEVDNDLISTIKVASSRNFKALGYKNRSKKELYGYVHLEQDNDGYFIFDVYCHKKIRSNVGPNRIPTNSIMNTEHTWPQSKGAKSEPRRGDLHHLYPTDSKANSVRGNYVFGEVDGKDAHSSCPQSQIGRMIDPFSGRVTGTRSFQPAADHQGNVARALFYFAARYGYHISDNEEYYLKKWHREDPVDDKERQRNDRIEDVQGNRNPFIDYPQIVSRISDF